MDELPVTAIANYLKDNPKAKIARIKRKEGYVTYVIERSFSYDKKTKKRTTVTSYLGRIVENVFYTMDEYKALFKKDGSLRTIPQEAVRPEKRTTATAHNAEALWIDRSRIIRLPHDSTLQFQRQGDNIYVFKREYYFLGNVRKESRRYIGKVKDGRFYTMTEYKEKFDRYGRKRVKRNKAVPQT